MKIHMLLNKKGFTLVELLAVIVLVAILLTIAVPSAIAISNRIKENMYKNKLKIIEKAASLYGQDNADSIPQCTEGSKTITVGFLLSKTYIEQDNKDENAVKDPRNNRNMKCDTMKVCLNKSNNIKVTVKPVEKGTSAYEDMDPVCNEFTPEPGISEIAIDLDSNMIPIKYNETLLRWEKADRTNANGDWYNYDEFRWANMVLVNSDTSRTKYKNANVGYPIVESEILAYYVWIPRYRYKLWNADYTSQCNSTNTTCPSERQIEIEFETISTKPSCGGHNLKGNDCSGGITPYGAASRVYDSGTNGTWLTHPAFRWGNREVNGFWVGKFELTGIITAPTVLPNQNSLRTITVSQFFTTIQIFGSDAKYGINNTAYDSHMIKNMEWGAMAYLSQSKYGKNGNPSYDGANKEIYINNHYVSSQTLSGCSSGETSAAQNSEACLYPYPSLDTRATGASSTGTIYGIYDISGGGSEYVMGNMASDDTTNYNSHTMNVGSAGSIGLFANPNSIAKKYYDIYSYDSSLTSHNRGHLGDATKENIKTFGSSSSGWYGDTVGLLSLTSTWFYRGGQYTSATNAGTFYAYAASGTSGAGSTSRPILIVD